MTYSILMRYLSTLLCPPPTARCARLLAYVQLWAARELTVHLPRPWERYLPQPPEGCITPSNVQRDWNRITAQMGTPAVAPKPRGKSPGRLKGQSQTPRKRQPVIKKGKKVEKKQPVTV